MFTIFNNQFLLKLAIYYDEFNSLFIYIVVTYNKMGLTDIIWFANCSYQNKRLVGGKNASLGELYRLSQKLQFSIADGFAITTQLYQDFLTYNNISESIEKLIYSLDTQDRIETIKPIADKIQNLFRQGDFTSSQKTLIQNHYRQLCQRYNRDENKLSVAIRSSAVAEDLPNASFAGQQDTYLNVLGADPVLEAVKSCFSSLFNTRAISYRLTHNIDFKDVLISVGVQKMVRSDLGSAGVAFSLDPETGYNKAVVINGSYGLGELVVSGGVKPDEFVVDKNILAINQDNSKYAIISKLLGDKKSKMVYNLKNNREDKAHNNTTTSDTAESKSTTDRVIEIATSYHESHSYCLHDNIASQLASTIVRLEQSYQTIIESERGVKCSSDNRFGIDVEWALDGIDGQMYIIQARPETVHSSASEDSHNLLVNYSLDSEDTTKLGIAISGVAVGEKISSGRVRVLESVDSYQSFQQGDILVTDMTTPDWEPIMKISSGVITNKGGRTCHAAIVAREMGLNAIVGTGNVTSVLATDMNVTMDCGDGEVGKVYHGLLPFSKQEYRVDVDKKLPVKLMLNVGSPENAFSASRVPLQKGVGLARLEFIIANYIKIHPLALVDLELLSSHDKNSREFQVSRQIREIIGEGISGSEYFINNLAMGIAKISSAFYPHDVIVRLSDFKSNEYRNLLGGELYEPMEENPMIGWRGASRYYSSKYQRGFRLECQAISRVRDLMKLTNTMVMIPFCRTPDECKKVTSLLEQYGLQRHKDGLKFILMCEIPSNVIEADLFSPYIDGVSIGGNDLLQLTLGIDRDSEMVTGISNDRNVSYRRMIQRAIADYHRHDKTVGFCGQQPSDSIEFCQFLIDSGIDSFSVTPDSALKTISQIK